MLIYSLATLPLKICDMTQTASSKHNVASRSSRNMLLARYGGKKMPLKQITS